MIKISNHYFHRHTFLHIVFDLGFVVAAVMVLTLPQAADPSSAVSTVVTKALLFAAGMLLINGALGFYQRIHTRTVRQTAARAAMSFCFSIPLSFVIFRLSPMQVGSERELAMMLIGVIALMLLNRVRANHATPKDLQRQRVLVFGTGATAKVVGRSLQKSDSSVDLVGYYASSNEETAEVAAWGLLSADKSLTDIVKEQHVDEIVVAVSERRGGSMPLRELLDCKLQGVRVVDIATHFEKMLGQIRLDSLHAGWLIFGDGFRQGLMRVIVKRLFDIVSASFLIVLALPIMIVTALLILLESGGPILYLQERVGLNGRLFKVVKFRSMRNDAEKDGTPRWASGHDHRVTRVGRIIRKLRIDELPQLYCVLIGDMSLVGPRPERPYFVDQLTHELPYYAVRQSIKPGITGWAQVRYHYGASFEDSAEKLQYDLYYVKNHSLFLDLVVLFETIGVVVTGKGAV